MVLHGTPVCWYWAKFRLKGGKFIQSTKAAVVGPALDRSKRGKRLNNNNRLLAVEIGPILCRIINLVNSHFGLYVLFPTAKLGPGLLRYWCRAWARPDRGLWSCLVPRQNLFLENDLFSGMHLTANSGPNFGHQHLFSAQQRADAVPNFGFLSSIMVCRGKSDTWPINVPSMGRTLALLLSKLDATVKVTIGFVLGRYWADTGPSFGWRSVNLNTR